MAAKEVLELIDEQKFHEARAILEEMNPVDIASVFEELDAEEMVKLFRILPKETAAEAFAYMTPEVQQNVITALTDKELRAVLDTLFMDDTIDMIEEMPANVVKRVLKVSDSETRGTIDVYKRQGQNSGYYGAEAPVTAFGGKRHRVRVGTDGQNLHCQADNPAKGRAAPPTD